MTRSTRRVTTEIGLTIGGLLCLAHCVLGGGLAPAAMAQHLGNQTVMTGAQVQAAENWALLDGRRIGLIVNQTSRLGRDHLIDVMHQSAHVNLTAIFAPEHGVRGNEEAGATVRDSRDQRTGVPIYSLYGRTRQPTRAMLRNIDVLVFDIQDIGVRFYTYASTMGLAMQAAARAGVEFVVLDRPNPLGGDYVSGFMLQPRHRSFIGQFEIPIAHGLTLGELARMIQGARLLPGLENLKLRVVPMSGWSRSMLWPDTGLEWVNPSPNIVDFETSLIYTGTGLFEGTSASEGRGTRHPFALLGAPWANALRLADRLNIRRLPGVRFVAASFQPRAIPGMAQNPKFRNKTIRGVRVTVTDHRAYQPVETGIHLLAAFEAEARKRRYPRFLKTSNWLEKLAGTSALRRALRNGKSPDQIIASWQAGVQRFRTRRKPYLLY